jgi:diacylglycerol kinase (ATP)
MPRKTKIILNPMADMRNAWRVANDLRPIIAQHGNADWSGTVYPTHAVELAREAGEQGYELIVAIGGDGTMHEVINGIMQLPEGKRPVLGVVPVGSGNDFAHAIGVSMQSDRAVAHALSGTPAPVDVGVLIDDQGHREYFDNTVGIGIDAVITIRSHRLPVVRGFLMYLTAAVQTILLNYDPALMQIESDGRTWEQRNLLLTMCNGPRQGGGFQIAPGARPDDGILNYTMIRSVGRPMMFRLLFEATRGNLSHFAAVTMGSCQKLSLTADRPLYIHADGEIFSGFGRDLRKVSFEIMPGALQVVQGQS